MSEITELLGQMSDDNPGAMSELMARVYDELRRLAAAYMRSERGDHTLQTTALVHEAYLRLIGQGYIAWKNRAHFLGVAAQMMRRVLVDHARAHLCRRRGGPEKRVSLDQVCISPRTHSADLVALDEALTRLAQTDPREAQIVELRFFGADNGRNSQDAGGLDQDCKPGLAGRPGVAARRDRRTAMTPQEWERVKQIFDGALAEPVADRARFVQSQCGEDSHIPGEVERLLAEHERASGFLDPPSHPSGRF